MAWGSPDVTRRRIQADQSVTYNGGVATQSIQHVGLLKSLLVRYNGSYTYTKSAGGSTQDAKGNFNALNNINVKVNGVGTFLDTDGWNFYLYNLVHYAPMDPASTDNANVPQTTATTSYFEFDAVPGASGTVKQLFQLRYPFTVELAGIKEIGLFVLQNDEINLQVTPTFNQVAGSATHLAQPYITAGGDTFALNTPTVDLVREFYGVPANKSDYPTIGWFHQVTTSRYSLTTTQTDLPITKGGTVLRVIYSLVDGTTPSLMANASISRLQWLYGSNDTPYDESITDVLTRQHQMYSHDLPQGVLVHDFWGSGKQTMRDTFDTMKYQNLRGRILTPSTPSAGSYVDVTVEKLIPIGQNPESLY